MLESRATYCNLCKCFRSAENVQADDFTRTLSVNSLNGKENVLYTACVDVCIACRDDQRNNPFKP